MTICDAATQEDLADHPKFTDIVIPAVDSEVGLLLRNDNLYATRSLDVKLAENGSYVNETVTGWVAYCKNFRNPLDHAKTFLA